jgi:iron complex outermembrane receptor protein
MRRALRSAGRLSLPIGAVGLVMIVPAPSAMADDTLDLGTVGIGGQSPSPPAANASPPGAGAPHTPVAAAIAIAPTAAPLAATQPTSRIGEAYIRNNVPQSATYDEIVRIAPSTVSISPNGPGLTDAADLTIRGFADGQYNVTFDGIPFADSDDFTHHSSAYFMTHDLGSVSVDRGPGGASTIGYATFGGTVSLLSRDPAATPGGTVYASYGSFATRLLGVELDTGPIAALNGGSMMLDLEHLDSDGYLTASSQRRNDVFFKSVQPLGDDTVMTIVATSQQLHQYQPSGATRAQIATYGPNFALSGDPASQNYYGYNGNTYRTDFEYLAVRSQVSDTLLLDNRLYTYALYRHFSNGEDVNGETPAGTAFAASDVPGQMARNDLRAYGDVLRLSETLPFGELRAGLWIEHQANQRGQYEVDMTLGGTPNPVLSPVGGVAGSAAIDRLQRETLDTVQPFIELDWKITPSLTLTPGLKIAVVDRNVTAPVMEGTRQTLSTDATYREPLPSVTLHYDVTPSWAAYLQAAKGFLAPQLQFLDVPDPKSDPVAPERTWNFQVGTSWRGQRVAASADAYYIDFENMVGSRTIGSNSQFFDLGGVNYLGLEGDLTVALDAGFSLYGNASLNSARQRSDGAPVPNTPQATMAGGVLYQNGPWNASVIDKWVGARYGDVERQQGLAPFNRLDASVGWTSRDVFPAAPPVTLQLLVQNILDSRKINALAGYTVAANTPLFFTQPGRSAFVNLAVRF